MASHTHEYINVGREVIEGLYMTVWKCHGCTSKKHTPAGTVTTTFP
jgi:hypothetical protein